MEGDERPWRYGPVMRSDRMFLSLENGMIGGAEKPHNTALPQWDSENDKYEPCTWNCCCQRTPVSLFCCPCIMGYVLGGGCFDACFQGSRNKAKWEKRTRHAKNWIETTPCDICMSMCGCK